MGEQTVASVTTVFLAIISLAVLATLVSKQANTTGVVSSVGSAFSGALTAATNPFSGGNSNYAAGAFQGAGYME